MSKQFNTFTLAAGIDVRKAYRRCGRERELKEALIRCQLTRVNLLDLLPLLNPTTENPLTPLEHADLKRFGYPTPLCRELVRPPLPSIVVVGPHIWWVANPNSKSIKKVIDVITVKGELCDVLTGNGIQLNIVTALQMGYPYVGFFWSGADLEIVHAHGFVE